MNGINLYTKYMEIYKKYKYESLKTNPEFFLESLFIATRLSNRKEFLKNWPRSFKKKPSKMILSIEGVVSLLNIHELQPKTVDKLNSLFNPILKEWHF